MLTCSRSRRSSRLRRVGDVWFGLLDEREEDLRVAAAGCPHSQFLEPFVRVLADRLKHRKLDH